ncbi:hypothetical protein NFI96_023573 [Prochilodus magdalenae]|nr:hypothetical protein NFI96_023573 [Prochilodus magdalenae]
MHLDIQLSGCTESDKEFIIEHDEEELIHSDFKKKDIVIKQPDFSDPIGWSGFYDTSVSEQEICKHNHDTAAKAYNNPPEAVDAPHSSIYPRDDVLLGTKNTLICHVTGFFPPPVNVSWTKNNMDVTDGTTLSQFYPNQDGTYNQFSHLSFTPEEGDIYSCTVKHKGLQKPNTKTWEVDVELPGVGPSVFCGVGLTAGLAKLISMQAELISIQVELISIQVELISIQCEKRSLMLMLTLLYSVCGNGNSASAFLLLDGYYNERRSQCLYRSRDFSDMVYIDSYFFNKIEFMKYNSTVGQFVGYTELGIRNAERLNKDAAFLQREQADVDAFCKHNAELYYQSIRDKSVPPKIKVKSVKQASGDHPAILMCSAYDFYPKTIDVYWLRDGIKMTSDVTSTEEMADGDWYYQVHSHLEYTPKSGEKISCVVEHASSNKPIVTEWIEHGGGSIMVWVLRSAAGCVELQFIEGATNADILKQSVLPSLQKPGHREICQHHNHPKHTSKTKVQDWSSMSPHLNPIKHLWVILKRKVEEHKVSNMHQLTRRGFLWQPVKL